MKTVTLAGGRFVLLHHRSFKYIPAMSAIDTIELRISGKVQGVWYRKYCREEALQLGLTGWICNEKDGSVRARATGTRSQLDRWVAWCRKGPAMARVTRVEQVQVPDQHFEGFIIRQTC